MNLSYQITFKKREKSDAQYIVKYCNQDYMSRLIINSHLNYPYTENDAIYFIENIADSNAEDTWCICVDGIPVGSIGLKHGEGFSAHTKEIGYRLGKDFWGKGITTYALRRIINYCRNSYPDVTKLIGGAIVGNIGSQRVQEKCGFVQEGVLKKQLYLSHDIGEWKSGFYDKVLYGLWIEK